MNDVIHPRVHYLGIFWEAIKTTIGAYAVTGKINALIDAGPPQSSPDVIASALKSINLQPKDIGYILFTHGHSDHIGGTRDIKAAGNVKIMIHQEDAFYLENHSLAFDRFYAMGRTQNIEQQKAAFLKQMGEEIKADEYIEDGRKIDLGDDVILTAVHLPGHSPGSVGYYWEKEGILIAGDSIPGCGSKGGILPILFDIKSYEKSVERLLNLDIRTLLFSHPYRGIKLAPSYKRQGAEVKEYLDDSLKIARKLNETFSKYRAKAGSVPIAETADMIISELPEEWGFKKIADLPVPDMSLGTIIRGLSQ